MKKLNRDTEGMGVFGVVAVVFVLGIALIIVPYIVGWAVAFLLHTITGDAEITAFWTRWFIGIAVIIVASLFKPEVYHKMGRSSWGRECTVEVCDDYRFE